MLPMFPLPMFSVLFKSSLQLDTKKINIILHLKHSHQMEQSIQELDQVKFVEGSL